jgi:hypothetical protein
LLPPEPERGLTREQIKAQRHAFMLRDRAFETPLARRLRKEKEEREREEQERLEAAHQRDIEHEALKLKAELASLRFEVVWAEFCRKYGYNPNQPRTPAGHGIESGRWAGSGSAARRAVQLRHLDRKVVRSWPGMDVLLQIQLWNYHGAWGNESGMLTLGAGGRRQSWQIDRERQLIESSMNDTDILRANFTISDAAKREIENLRRFWNENVPDPAGVLTVSWGFYHFNSGEKAENVVLSFFGQSELPRVAFAIQRVSGIDLVFNTWHQDLPKFEGKVIDHTSERSFFLRKP